MMKRMPFLFGLTSTNIPFAKFEEAEMKRFMETKYFKIN